MPPMLGPNLFPLNICIIFASQNFGLPISAIEDEIDVSTTKATESFARQALKYACYMSNCYVPK